MKQNNTTMKNINTFTLRLTALLLLTAIALLWAGTTRAQPGNITYTIATQNPELNGDSLTIYCYQPTGYNPALPNPAIIGIHGLGDPENSEQIRQYLTPLADSLNALLLCPNPYLQDQPRTTAALNEALDFIEQTYTLDQNNLYLCGYSAGSDAAAQYAYSSPKHPVKMLFWHSPGFYATPDMQQQATFPPTCLLCGSTDFVSLLQANILNATFDGSSVPYYYNELPGVGHTMNYPELTTELLECIQALNAGTGIATNSSTQGLSIYPNPAGNSITIDAELRMQNTELRMQNAELTIFNAQGQQVMLPIAIGTTLNSKHQTLNIADLSSGIYYLSLINGNQQSHHRFIKQ